MIGPEQVPLVFIVRIWYEPHEIPASAPELRGAIEHIPSGERRYFQRLDQVTEYLQEFLKSTDASP